MTDSINLTPAQKMLMTITGIKEPEKIKKWLKDDNDTISADEMKEIQAVNSALTAQCLAIYAQGGLLSGSNDGTITVPEITGSYAAMKKYAEAIGLSNIEEAANTYCSATSFVDFDQIDSAAEEIIRGLSETDFTSMDTLKTKLSGRILSSFLLAAQVKDAMELRDYLIKITLQALGGKSLEGVSSYSKSPITPGVVTSEGILSWWSTGKTQEVDADNERITTAEEAAEELRTAESLVDKEKIWERCSEDVKKEPNIAENVYSAYLANKKYAEALLAGRYLTLNKSALLSDLTKQLIAQENYSLAYLVVQELKDTYYLAFLAQACLQAENSKEAAKVYTQIVENHEPWCANNKAEIAANILQNKVNAFYSSQDYVRAVQYGLQASRLGANISGILQKMAENYSKSLDYKIGNGVDEKAAYAKLKADMAVEAQNYLSNIKANSDVKNENLDQAIKAYSKITGDSEGTRTAKTDKAGKGPKKAKGKTSASNGNGGTKKAQCASTDYACQYRNKK